MIRDLHQLIDEAIDLTGAAPPLLLEDDSPNLAEEAIESRDPAPAARDSDAPPSDGDLYIVGLIGGKDVGKSSLVNALIGQPVSEPTSHGRGTDRVIAYVHRSRAAELARLLDREAPGQYEMVVHDLPNLTSQALIDLPDIDSHYASHVELTRRMLRHMLYPIWIQSVEKYADLTPQLLLERVAAGNSPENFMYCLNKADQLIEREGPEAGEELRADYAQRIAKRLRLSGEPKVWLISAARPDRYDLPPLRASVMRQKAREVVVQSKRLAARRQGASLIEWLEGQQLDAQLDRMERLWEEAKDEIGARIGAPLLERALPSMADDAANRMAFADEILQQRVARWPIVNALHEIMKPLSWLIRRRLSLAEQRGLEGPEPLVDTHLGRLEPTLAVSLQGVFGRLQQSHSQMLRIYRDRKLWEPMASEYAAAELRQSLAETIQRQRAAARQRFGGPGFLVGAIVRGILTLGALVWFPFGQPALLNYLSTQGQVSWPALAVQILGASYLLQSAALLLVYYLVLWGALKWDTGRKVDRWLGRWRKSEGSAPELSLNARALEWLNGLLLPIQDSHGRVRDLAARAKAMQARLAETPADARLVREALRG